MLLDTSLHTVVMTVAAVTSLVLAVGALARRPRGLLHWSFALGMVGFAAESMAAWVLVTQTVSSEARLSSLQTLEMVRLVLVIPWAIFAVGLLNRGKPQAGRALLYQQLGWIAVLVATLATVALVPAYRVSDVEAPFYAAGLGASGQLSALVQLVSMVGLLATFEAALRTSRGFARWRTKFLVLGLGGALLIRFYFLSQTLLFNVVMGPYLTAIASAQIVANLVVFTSLMRDRLTAELVVSREMVYRSVAAGVLGLYLVAVGILGWLLNHLGLSEAVVWGSLVIFVTAVGLAAVMLSESVRWKIKRFVTSNFYRSKYDYRLHWMSFTKRLGSILTVEELAPQLLHTVVDAVGTTTGALYVRDPSHSGYHAVSYVGFTEPTHNVASDNPAVATLRTVATPIVLGDTHTATWPTFHPDFRDGSVAVPMRRGDDLIGFLLVGTERTGSPYTGEDLEFLSTVAEQAAVAISTVQLSETLAQSREFEAFHRLTSFVIHDLKNSISALSMLSENALRHFDDPDFQRDAIKTLARTVERMTALLGRLSSGPELVTLTYKPVDIATLVLEATMPLLKHSRIAVVKDLAPVPPIPGDLDALLRVVQNIVTNAIQSIPNQGTITLKTFEANARACIAITDTGCGMSEEFIRKSLFAPFRSTKTSGWGIGMYQARGIVEAHGGSIEVTSIPGRGTTFVIALPIAQAKRAGTDTRPPHGDSRSR